MLLQLSHKGGHWGGGSTKEPRSREHDDRLTFLPERKKKKSLKSQALFLQCNEIKTQMNE